MNPKNIVLAHLVIYDHLVICVVVVLFANTVVDNVAVAVADFCCFSNCPSYWCYYCCNCCRCVFCCCLCFESFFVALVVVLVVVIIVVLVVVEMI